MISPKSDGDPIKKKVIGRALSSFIDGSRAIIDCKDIFTNYLIDRLPMPSFGRMFVCATMTMGALYLDEKNRSSSRKIIDAMW